MFLKYLPLLFASIAALAQYLSGRADVRKKVYGHKIISFSAGMSITYIILEFFPFFTANALSINKLLFISVLSGFSIHHLIEKEIYQHSKDHDLLKKLSLEENVFSYVYHFILGILLVTFTLRDPQRGFLYFVLVLSFTSVSNLSTKNHQTNKRAIFFSSSTIIGTLFATFIWTIRPLWLETLLSGFVLGVLLFTVTRHHIPFGAKGKVGYYSLGFIFYSLLIIGSWYI
jgi:hypothetical protein